MDGGWRPPRLPRPPPAVTTGQSRGGGASRQVPADDNAAAVGAVRSVAAPRRQVRRGNPRAHPTRATPAHDGNPSPRRRSVRIGGHEITSGVGGGVGGGGVGGSGRGSGGGSNRTEGAVAAEPPSGRSWPPSRQLAPRVRRDKHDASKEPAAEGRGGRRWGRWRSGKADLMALSYVAVPRLPEPLRDTVEPGCLCRGCGFTVRRRPARVYRRGSEDHFHGKTKSRGGVRHPGRPQLFRVVAAKDGPPRGPRPVAAADTTWPPHRRDRPQPPARYRRNRGGGHPQAQPRRPRATATTFNRQRTRGGTGRPAARRRLPTGCGGDGSRRRRRPADRQRPPGDQWAAGSGTVATNDDRGPVPAAARSGGHPSLRPPPAAGGPADRAGSHRVRGRAATKPIAETAGAAAAVAAAVDGASYA